MNEDIYNDRSSNRRLCVGLQDTPGLCVFPQLLLEILVLTCEKCHMDVYRAAGHLAPICEDAHISSL